MREIKCQGTVFRGRKEVGDLTSEGFPHLGVRIKLK